MFYVASFVLSLMIFEDYISFNELIGYLPISHGPDKFEIEYSNLQGIVISSCFTYVLILDGRWYIEY